MKVLVNGGLNCSVRDGWWDEAYERGLGWSIGDGGEEGANIDAAEAEDTYDLIDHAIAPEFYDRDETGLPRAWVMRIRRSMSTLTSAFSGARMAREYVEEIYLGAAAAIRCRASGDYALAKDLAECRPVCGGTGPVYTSETRPSAQRMIVCTFRFPYSLAKSPWTMSRSNSIRIRRAARRPTSSR